MSAITTHVLDVARGRPAANVPVVLDLRTDAGEWQTLARSITDVDGRVRNLLPAGQAPTAGVYRLSFDVGSYFAAAGVDSLYPSVSIVFQIRKSSEHYHLPLLLSPFGYSTYRGS